MSILSVITWMAASLQSPDSTLHRVEDLGLPTLDGEVVVHYVEGRRPRAESLRRSALRMTALLRDSLGVQPPSIAMAVLDEKRWEQAVPWELPYGIHQMFGPPYVFVVPSEVDRGQYYSPDDPQPELRVDLIGLHYLAHHYAAAAMYATGVESAKPVKWMDEIFTLAFEIVLREAFDPRLNELSVEPGPSTTTFRVTTLRDFDEEYRGYFVTPEGAANYAWFMSKLERVASSLLQEHGWELFRRLRLATREDLTSREALVLFQRLGARPEEWGIPSG